MSKYPPSNQYIQHRDNAIDHNEGRFLLPNGFISGKQGTGDTKKRPEIYTNIHTGLFVVETEW